MGIKNTTNLIFTAARYTKKLSLLLFFCLPSVAAIGQNIRYDTIRYAKEYYQKRVAAFNSEKVVKYKIIFLGNSLTQFGDWGKLLGDSTVINRGIAGDNTYGVLARLNDVMIRKPERLFIEIGINDISQNIPQQIIIKNMLSIVKQVHKNSPGTKVYVTSILPTNDNVKTEYPASYHKNKQINFINGQLMRHTGAADYTYIDLNKWVKDKKGDLDVKYAKPDGLHLNQQGYGVWIKLINKQLTHQLKN
nr:GDSL-type esterase/lipase family protein [uncultured Mucilaginibacter sp.]